MSKQVAVKIDTIGDYSGYSAYRDEVKSNDLIMPMISITQPLTPSVQSGDTKIGNIYNSVTGEIYSGEKGIVIQPVAFNTMVVEWRPRTTNEGIVARYEVTDEFILRKKRENGGSMIKLKNGDNELVETVYMFANILTDDGLNVDSFAVFPAKSGQLKCIRTFRTAMNLISGNPPYLAFRATLTTIFNQNGPNIWHSPVIKPFNSKNWKTAMIDPKSEKHLLEAGARLADMVRDGNAVMDEDSLGRDSGEVKSTYNDKFQSIDDDDDVPF